MYMQNAEWDEEIRERLYAIFHAWMKSINEGIPRNTNGFDAKEVSEHFYLLERTWWARLKSLGIRSTKLKKSGKVPHWVVNPQAEIPADMENNVVIPDPFYSKWEFATPMNDNCESDLGLLVPKETAKWIILLESWVTRPKPCTN